MDDAIELAIPAEPDAPVQPPYDREAWRKAHVYEVAGQVTFTVGGVAAAIGVTYAAVCVTVYSVSWRDQCRGPARIAVGTTGLALGGGALAIYGSYAEAHALETPWTEGIVGVSALGLSLPVLAFGGAYVVADRPAGVPLILAGAGLVNLGVASTACQVRYGHREARRLGLMDRRSLRLRRDFAFCNMLDAFTFAVTPTSASFALRW